MVDWKLGTYCSLLVHFATESYIDHRQFQILNNKELPSTIKNLFDQRTVEESLSYERDRLKLKRIHKFKDCAFSILFVHFNVHKIFWDYSGAWCSIPHPSSITQVILCLMLFETVKFLTSMPFDYYGSFVVEEKYGFNKSTTEKFYSDAIKSFVFGRVVSSLFTIGLLRVISYGGDSFVLYASVFLAGFYCFVMTVIPLFVLPWFYKLTRLENGELKASIDELANRLDFPVSKIYVCDGSSRSSHSNAFFTGLPWAKYIVIYDTLIEKATTQEIVGVLAHELGHWKNMDIIRLTTWSFVDSLIGLHLFSMIYKSPSFYRDFGFSTTQPIYIGFKLFNDVSKITDLLSMLAGNSLTRILEYRADKFAANLGYKNSLGNALIKLELENLASTNIDWLYSLYCTNHPSLSERLEAMGALKAS